MTRYLIALGAIILILLLLLAGWLFSSIKGSVPTRTETVTFPSGNTMTVLVERDAKTDPEVQTAFVSQIENADQIILGDTVIASDYALQTWGDEDKGGQAVLRQNAAGVWELLSMGGGAWDVASLTEAGVPQSVAEKLVHGN